MGEQISSPETRLPSQAQLLAEVTSQFLRLGFTAFGGPAAHIAMMRQEFVQRRKWLSDERFIDLMSVINLIPGPNSTQLAIYLGYLRAGWPGLILAGVCFIGPAMLIVLALAWLYVRYGALPEVGWLLYGIKAVVIAIIAQAIWGLSKTVLKGPWAILSALAMLILYLLGVNEILLLLGGGIVYGVLRWQLQRKKQETLSLALPALPLLKLWPASLSSVSALLTPLITSVDLTTLFLSFLKVGLVVYGSGYILLAFLRDEFVLNLGWLTDRQLLDAVSIGQFTPGPVFTTATFIGYLLAGLPGALLATLGIFLPSFFFVPLIHPLASRLRSFRLTSNLLDGLNIAALALMTGVLIQLGRSNLTDIFTWLLALLSFALLLRFKFNSIWLIIAGAALGLLRFWLL